MIKAVFLKGVKLKGDVMTLAVELEDILRFVRKKYHESLGTDIGEELFQEVLINAQMSPADREEKVECILKEIEADEQERIDRHFDLVARMIEKEVLDDEQTDH